MKKTQKVYKGLICGPYIGDFKQEICTFIPYVNFIKSILKYNKFFISSHYNRRFLYEDDDTFVPVETEYTESEEKQINYYYNDINKKQYQKFFYKSK